MVHEWPREEGAMRTFDRSNEKSAAWVKDMMAFLAIDNREAALHALRAGLHALRDRLTVEEAAQLAAQMPMTIRGLFFENWRPADKPLRIRHPNDFLALVIANYQPRSDIYADDIIGATFKVLSKHVSQGELTDVVMSLPEPLLELVGGRREWAADREKGGEP
jgi:uncharacterized protein (DUF2267 family)